MKLFTKSSDGGKDSGVTGYWLIEDKTRFSIVLLHFNKGSREAYHEHAFNAWTLWLWGSVLEHTIRLDRHPSLRSKLYLAGQLKYTPRERFHMVEARSSTWALSFRGPWLDTWRELRRNKLITLTHGRKEV